METNNFNRDEDFDFWKNLILVASFFVIAPITLGISLFSLVSIKNTSVAKAAVNTQNLMVGPLSGVKVYASLPTELPSVSGSVEQTDARPAILRQYMDAYGSPLAPYADLIVQAADKYSLDFRLITAIAQQESNLCKVIPPESYNCWGWGITGQGTLGFTSYQDGIDQVSKGLRENYINKGFLTIDSIMSKYTPQSNGSWAFGVNQFMTDMQ